MGLKELLQSKNRCLDAVIAHCDFKNGDILTQFSAPFNQEYGHSTIIYKTDNDVGYVQVSGLTGSSNTINYVAFINHYAYDRKLIFSKTQLSDEQRATVSHDTFADLTSASQTRVRNMGSIKLNFSLLKSFYNFFTRTKSQVFNIPGANINSEVDKCQLSCSAYVCARIHTSVGVDIVPNLNEKSSIEPKDILRNSNFNLDIQKQTDKIEKDKKLRNLILSDDKTRNFMSNIIDEENKIVKRMTLAECNDENAINNKFKSLMRNDKVTIEAHKKLTKLVKDANWHMRLEQNKMLCQLAEMKINLAHDQETYDRNMASLVSTTGLSAEEIEPQINVWRNGMVAVSVLNNAISNSGFFRKMQLRRDLNTAMARLQSNKCAFFNTTRYITSDILSKKPHGVLGDATKQWKMTNPEEVTIVPEQRPQEAIAHERARVN